MGSAKKKVKGGLVKSFLKAAQIYLVPMPFRKRKPSDGTFSYIPKSWKYVPSIKEPLIGIFMQQVLHFGVGAMMYPSPEEFLISRGFDQETAAQLDPGWFSFVKPLVQERDFIDKIHHLTSSPTIFGIYSSYDFAQSPSSGDALSDFSGCSISFSQDKNFNFFSDLESGAFFVKKGTIDVENLLVSKEVAVNYSLLHEIVGHCNFSQLSQLWQNNEMRADSKSIQAISKLGNPEVAEFVLYFRSSSVVYTLNSEIDPEHDVGLYLDALIRQVPLPTERAVKDSRQEFVGLIRQHMYDKHQVSKKPIVKSVTIDESESYEVRNNNFSKFVLQNVKQVLDTNIETMSPLARRRAELYLEGFAYFMPELFKETLGYLPPKATVQQNPNLQPTIR